MSTSAPAAASAAPTVTLSGAQKIIADAQTLLTTISNITGQAIASGASKTTIVLNDIVAGAEVVDPPVASLIIGGVELVGEAAPLVKLFKSIF